MLSAADIFARAIEIDSDEERRGYVAGACGDDEELLAKVNKLLGFHDEADEGRFMPTGEFSHDAPIIEGPGSVIGRYKLLQQIGEGGFGVVYMAEQREPVKRRLALKIIKLGMDTKHVVGRFEAERQALALMDHPNIAKVLDAGATENGRPFFVMELVRGIPITKFCDENRLTTDERLRLFMQVCQAINHAHQKGVIHRDIKPNNVLVSLGDHHLPNAKVIDFGIAKATQQELTDKTLFTRFEDFVGTPAYMSPEQAQYTQLDIDTRTDIYSLGVLLYELLTGSTPLETSSTSGIDELRRRIREDEPQRPSTKFHSIEQTARTKIADNRQADPENLRRKLRNELDWIIMKAIDKDRSRRYETAAAICRDIESYLYGEEVEACPPTTAYRFKKLVRRNKGPFTIAAAVFFALLLGGIVATWQAIRVTIEKKRGDDWLWSSQVVHVRAMLKTNAPGRRHETLATIRKAASFRATPELRNDAITAMALPDVRLIETLDAPLPPRPQTCVDHSGSVYVVASEEGDFQLRRLSDHAEIRRIPNEDGEVGEFNFSPDGRFLAGLRPFGSVEIWEVATGERVVHRPKAMDFAFSEDGRFIAIADPPSRQIVLYQMDRQEVVWSVPIPGDVWHMRFDAGGVRLAAALRNSPDVFIYDLFQERDPQHLALDAVAYSLAWHPGGNHLAVGLSDFGIQILELTSQRVVNLLKGHDAQVVRLQFQPRGNLLVSYAWDRTTRIWEPFAGISSIQLRGQFEKFLEDGKQMQMDLDKPGAAIWELTKSAACFSRYRIDGAPEDKVVSLAFSPNSRWLIGAAHPVHLWDLRTSERLATLETASTRRVRFDGRDTRVLISGKYDGLRRYEIVAGGEEGGFQFKESGRLADAPTHDFDRSADGEALAVHQEESARKPVVRVIDAITGQEMAVIQMPLNASKVSLHPNGEWLATGSWHGRGVRLWNLADFEAKPINLFTEQRHAVPQFDPGGKWFAASFSPGEKRHLWRVGEWGEPVKTIHGVTATSFAFDPNGRYVACEVASGNIGLIDLETTKILAELRAPISNPSRIKELAISPDGAYLAAASSLREIFVWHLPTMRKTLGDMGLDWE